MRWTDGGFRNNRPTASLRLWLLSGKRGQSRSVRSRARVNDCDNAGNAGNAMRILEEGPLERSDRITGDAIDGGTAETAATGQTPG